MANHPFRKPFVLENVKPCDLKKPTFIEMSKEYLLGCGMVVIRDLVGLTNIDINSFLRNFGDIAPGGDQEGLGRLDIKTLFDDRGVCRNKDDSTIWHLDNSFFARPAKETLLYCVSASQDDVQTHFCDMYDLYENMDKDLREDIQFATAVHSFSHNRKGREPVDFGGMTVENTLHPLVFKNPINNRNVLYYSESKIVKLLGVDPLVEQRARDHFRELLSSERYHYSHSWADGDLVLFDAVGKAHRRDPIPGQSFRYLKSFITLFDVPKPTHTYA